MTTTSLIKALSILMIKLSPEWGSIETTQERETRLTMTAKVIVEQAEIARPRWGWPLDAIVAFLFVQAKWESWYKLSVHTGKERGPFGERCLFQVHRKAYLIPAKGYELPPFDSLEGTSYEATTACVKAGITIDLWHHARCRANTRYAHEGFDVARFFTAIHTPTPSCQHALGPGLSRAFDFKVYWWRLRLLAEKVK